MTQTKLLTGMLVGFLIIANTGITEEENDDIHVQYHQSLLRQDMTDMARSVSRLHHVETTENKSAEAKHRLIMRELDILHGTMTAVQEDQNDNVPNRYLELFLLEVSKARDAAVAIPAEYIPCHHADQELCSVP